MVIGFWKKKKNRTFLPSSTIRAIACWPSPRSSALGLANQRRACSSLPATVWAGCWSPYFSALATAVWTSVFSSPSFWRMLRARPSACGVAPWPSWRSSHSASVSAVSSEQSFRSAFWSSGRARSATRSANSMIWRIDFSPTPPRRAFGS